MLTPTEVAIVVAVIALIGTVISVVQKRVADRRDAWWGRTQWALQQVLADQDADETRRTVGLVVLTTLQGSHLATPEERDMLEQVADALLPSFLDETP